MLKSLAHTFSHHSQLPLFRTRTLSLFFRRALSNSTKSRIRRVFTAVTHTHSHDCAKWVCWEFAQNVVRARARPCLRVCACVCASSSLLVWHQTVSACQNRHVVHVSFPVAWLEMRAAAQQQSSNQKAYAILLANGPQTERTASSNPRTSFFPFLIHTSFTSSLCVFCVFAT